MRRGVVGEDVVAALLVDEDPCRILASVVDLVAEAAHAPVELVVRDVVSRRPPHGEAPARKETHVVVDHERVIDARQADAVLPLSGAARGHGHAFRVLDVNAGAIAEPFVAVILVTEEPVSAVLAARCRLEVLAVVCGDVAVQDLEPIASLEPQADVRAADGQPPDDEAFAPLGDDAKAFVLIRGNAVLRADERDPRKVHGDAIPADMDDAVVVRIGDAIRAGFDPDALLDQNVVFVEGQFGRRSGEEDQGECRQHASSRVIAAARRENEASTVVDRGGTGEDEAHDARGGNRGRGRRPSESASAGPNPRGIPGRKRSALPSILGKSVSNSVPGAFS